VIGALPCLMCIVDACLIGKDTMALTDNV